MACVRTAAMRPESLNRLRCGRWILALLLVLGAYGALAQDFPPSPNDPPTPLAPSTKPQPVPESVPVPAAEAEPVTITPLPVAIAPSQSTGAEPAPTDSGAPTPTDPEIGAEDSVLAPPIPGFTGPPEIDPRTAPGDPLFIGPPVVPNFQLLGESVVSGTRRRLEWSASDSFAGGEVVSPVMVVHGTRPGPVLCLASAIHGDEINGVEVVRRVATATDPDSLSGTLVAVPIVNLFGFSRNSRYLPDRRDLNRFFPGTRYGSIAARIAYSFFAQVIRHCDALVDFHTGSFERSNLPQVRADLRLPEVVRLARGFGSIPVLHSNGTRGMLRLAAVQNGIPAVTFEIGAPATLEPAEIADGVRGLESLMHNLGMIRSDQDVSEPQAVFYDSQWVRVDSGGLLMADIELGQRVKRGERLGWVIDPIRNIEHEVVSPIFGRVIGMARNQVVLPGYASYHLGEETSAEAAAESAATGVVDNPVEEDAAPVDREN